MFVTPAQVDAAIAGDAGFWPDEALASIEPRKGTPASVTQP